MISGRRWQRCVLHSGGVLRKRAHKWCQKGGLKRQFISILLNVIITIIKHPPLLVGAASGTSRGSWAGSINQNPLLQFHLDKTIFFFPHICSVKQFEVCTLLFFAGSVLLADD